MTRSEYVIPCVCGAQLRSHERETACPECGRVISIEWGQTPKEVVGRPHQEALFDFRPDGLEPSR